MAHQHNHTHSHAGNNIRIAFLLNLGFTLFEAIGGLYVNSVAILSDALHDLGDSFSLGISWYLQKNPVSSPMRGSLMDTGGIRCSARSSTAWC